MFGYIAYGAFTARGAMRRQFDALSANHRLESPPNRFRYCIKALVKVKYGNYNEKVLILNLIHG